LGSVSRNSWQTWIAWDAAIAKRLVEINETHVLTAGDTRNLQPDD
jgi:hypothetical protein